MGNRDWRGLTNLTRQSPIANRVYAAVRSDLTNVSEKGYDARVAGRRGLKPIQ